MLSERDKCGKRAFDILDENGNKTGAVKLRSEVNLVLRNICEEPYNNKGGLYRSVVFIIINIKLHKKERSTMSEIIEDGFKGGQNAAWGKLKHVPFNNKESAAERKFVKLEDLEPILNIEETCIFGHGTASAGNGHDVVDSIFADGMKGFQSLDSTASESMNLDEVVGSTKISDTAKPIYAFEKGQESGSLAKLKEKLDHWKHRDSSNIILIRLPFKYFNMYSGDEGEKDAPFFIQKRDDSGQMRNYLDPRFIIGNYNRETSLVELNEQFENEMSDEFQKEMDQRLMKAQEETNARLSLQGDNYFGTTAIENDTTGESNPDTYVDDSWENEEW